MPLAPGYGETPVPEDELATLLPDAVLMLGEPVTRAATHVLTEMDVLQGFLHQPPSSA